MKKKACHVLACHLHIHKSVASITLPSCKDHTRRKGSTEVRHVMCKLDNLLTFMSSMKHERAYERWPEKKKVTQV